MAHPLTFPGAMSEFPNLPQAPIREALIDFRVPGTSDEATLGALESLAKDLGSQYPKMHPIQRFEGRFQVGDGGAMSAYRGPEPRGYRLDDDEDRNVAQLQVDGFTFSRLAPYRSWDRMLEDAWAVWDRYAATINPGSVERVATRFINSIALPRPGALDQVFRSPPVAPAGKMENFLFRYELAPADGVTAVVSLATEDALESSVILDIDCFVRESLPLERETLQRSLSRVRDAKNRIFFRSLTDEAIARYR